MLERKSIVCFAPTDWWAMNPSCTTHIMQKLAGKNRVLYVNPFSSDLLGSVKSTRGLGPRVARKLKSIAMYLKQPENNLYVFSPLFLPLHGQAAIDTVNNTLLKFQIKAVCRFIGLSEPILWLENIRAADAMDWFEPALTVYHVSDLFAADTYTVDQQAQRNREKSISDRSDLVICVSRELYNLKRSERGNVFYIPHGVDFDLFREAAERQTQMEELAGISRPIAGYYGTLTDSNDVELLEYCARRLPDVSFVFAGQITGGDYSGLRRLGNVRFLGRIPYKKIPQLCASFDVCMMAWRMHEWIKCCNPLKMIEYMASGKPVVSVPIREAMRYCDLVSIASSKEEFVDAIRSELKNDTPQRAQRRIAIANEHDWHKQVDRISQLITHAIAVKRSENGGAKPAPKEICG